jgi:hypothetical protein
MATDFRAGKLFPRRGRDPLGGFLWLARVFDKARASAAGTIHDYIYPCPMDRGMFQHWGITSKDFDAAIRAHPTDDGILDWLRGRTDDSRRDAANRWLLKEKRSNLDRQDAEEGALAS